MTGEEGLVRAVRQFLIEERRNWIRQGPKGRRQSIAVMEECMIVAVPVPKARSLAMVTRIDRGSCLVRYLKR